MSKVRSQESEMVRSHLWFWLRKLYSDSQIYKCQKSRKMYMASKRIGNHIGYPSVYLPSVIINGSYIKFFSLDMPVRPFRPFSPLSSTIIDKRTEEHTQMIWFSDSGRSQENRWFSWLLMNLSGVIRGFSRLLTLIRWKVRKSWSHFRKWLQISDNYNYGL